MFQGLHLSARTAARAALVAGYLFMLAANLPGHMSFDSVMSLYEGRFHTSQSWNPALFGWILGVFDGVVAGTSLYVTVSALLVFGGWIALTGIRDTASWLGAAVAALLVLTPNILIYQGVVWKDVLCANTAVAGFICLAFAARDWRLFGRRALLLLAAALLFAVAASVRQNGLIAALAAALSVAWAARGRGWPAAVGSGVAWLALVAVIAQLLALAPAPSKTNSAAMAPEGVRILQHYDLAAAIASDPKTPLPEIKRHNPEAEAYIRATAGAYYSPQRVDYLSGDEKLAAAFWTLPEDVVRAEWLGLITGEPALYLKTRFDAYRWLVASPSIDRCLPVYVGVDGSPEQMAELDITRRMSRNDRRLSNYASWFKETPAISHLAYGIVALITALALVWRRREADIAMAAMLAGGLGFAASFFVISIACDYRYLYFLDLAAMTGLLYVALDPTGFRRRARPGFRPPG